MRALQLSWLLYPSAFSRAPGCASVSCPPASRPSFYKAVDGAVREVPDYSIMFLPRAEVLRPPPLPVSCRATKRADLPASCASVPLLLPGPLRAVRGPPWSRLRRRPCPDWAALLHERPLAALRARGVSGKGRSSGGPASVGGPRGPRRPSRRSSVQEQKDKLVMRRRGS